MSFIKHYINKVGFRNLKLIILPVLLILLVIIGVTRTIEFKNTKAGDQAVQNMSSEEKTYLNNTINRINKNSTKDEVKKILGKEIDPGYLIAGDHTVHKCPGNSSNCTITVTYIDGKAYTITWLSAGRFFYTKEF